MKTVIALVTAGFLCVAGFAHAQGWRDIERQCVEADEESGEPGGSSRWPMWAACTARRTFGDALTQEQFNACFRTTEAAFRNISFQDPRGDRVAYLMGCLGAR